MRDKQFQEFDNLFEFQNDAEDGNVVVNFFLCSF